MVQAGSSTDSLLAGAAAGAERLEVLGDSLRSSPASSPDTAGNS